MRHIFYDSLKRFLMAILLTIVGIFSATADGTTAIQSVTVVGATQQSGTPTPNAPMDIVSNNGVLKARHQSGLPLGYTKLEYIQSGGTQYIDTGVSFADVDTTELKFKFANIAASTHYTVIGSSDDSNYNIPFCYQYNQYKLKSVLGTQSNATNMTPDTTTVYDVTSVLKSGTQTLTVNGSTFSGTVSGTSNGKNYWLFGMNRNGSLNQGSALIMYSTKLYKDGVMVRDFVPARRNSDNELGMYDTVSGQFFTNAGTGDFVAGNPVSDPVEIYTDGTVETIADSANHTATVATLLGVGDYKDEQNINTGAITRKVGIKVLDGTEDWNYSSNTFHWDIGPTGIAPNAQTLCTSYAYGTFGNFTMSGGNSWRLQLRDNRFTTKQELTSWLADQYNAGTPVIVIYPLVTETTESVTGQTMTTAPVRQVSGSLATTIRTMLTNGQELITESISSGIKIATTKYTEEAFAGLVTTLNEAIDKVTNIVNDTVQQATEIGVLAETKQDRPETDCPAGRKCLLIMGADNKPHWYLIQE